MATAIDSSLITVGGPCKIIDNSTSAGLTQSGAATIYTEEDVTIEPVIGERAVPSSVGGEQDTTITDLTWKIVGQPKAIWTTAVAGAIVPAGIVNWTTAGGRVCGSANRYVTVIGSDGEMYIFARGCVTKPARLFFGLGKSLYGSVEWTCYIGSAAQTTDTGAFYVQSTGATWSQVDYPTTHQEAIATAAWGAVTGWTTLFAEDGFSVEHEVKLTPVKMGNLTVDHRISGYRAACKFKPEQPTSAQLLTALGLQGASMGVGTRMSSRANSFVITAPGVGLGGSGTSISCTIAGASLNKGAFLFSNKVNRHGEFAMITSLTTPAARITLA